MQRMGASRPTLPATVLPGTPQRIALDVRFSLGPVPPKLPYPPEELPPFGAAMQVVVQDSTGMIYRFQAGAVASDTPDQVQRLIVDMTWPLDGGGIAVPQYPLSLLAVEFRELPQPYAPRSATFDLMGVQTSDSIDGDTWTPVVLPADPPGWTVTFNTPRGAVDAPALNSVQTGVNGSALSLDLYTGSVETLTLTPVVFSMGFGQPTFAGPLPALVSDKFLDATETSVGETLPVDVGRTRRDIQIVGVVHGFPTLDPEKDSLIIIDLPTFAMAEYATDGTMISPDEWWLSTNETDQIQPVAQALEQAPYSSPRVTDRITVGQTLLNDPVALGIIGSLALGFVAAALFAAIGFAVSAAVSARERLTEFALLRALGLSTRQLSGWLSLENGLLVGISIVGGTVLGLVLAWAVLPLVSLTQQAASVVPGVIVVIPWGTVLVLESITVIALFIVVALLAGFLRRLGLGSVLRLGGE
jgi:hypothetical protein